MMVLFVVTNSWNFSKPISSVSAIKAAFLSDKTALFVMSIMFERTPISLMNNGLSGISGT